MKWSDIDQQVCAVARTLSVVGDRWSLLIIRDAFLGTRRFADFQRQLGVTKHRLSDRLSQLVDAGVFKRVPYQEKPRRFEYRLTKKGVELYPIVMSMAMWGSKWMDDGNGAPVEYVHADCGHKTQPYLCCSECGEAIAPQAITPVLGPGLLKAFDAGRGMWNQDGEGGNPQERVPPLLKGVMN